MNVMRAIAGLLLAVILLCPSAALAVCGDAVLNMNEECDPGGALHLDGNPNLASCVNAGNCFFDFSCCKFNCQFVGQGASCFDGNACTTNDVCGNVGQCNAGGSAGAGTACEDGAFCTTGDTCNASGTCLPGGGNPCTGLECVLGCNETTNACNIDVGGPCTSDANLCTNDVCNVLGACTHPNNTVPCQDNLFCNGADTCSGGSCSAHTGNPCTGGGQCANTCNEAGDTCNLPNATPCNDGLFCTQTDGCLAGTCVGSGDPCSGGGQCADTCSEAGDTCNLPNATPCDDGLFCTDTDGCVAGACVGSGDPCTGGAECSAGCNEIVDDCFDLDGTVCTDDGNPCTDDYCDGAGGCIHVANTVSCDDGLGCTANDVCDGGICRGDPPPECDDDNPCTVDSCVEPSGECVNYDEVDPSCNDALVGALTISNRDDVMGRDKLKWRWSKSATKTPITLLDVGDPLNTTTYDLCVYDTSCPEPCPDPELGAIRTLRARVTVPPSMLWRDLSNKGRFIYRDPPASSGVSLVKMKIGTEPGVGVKANRTNLVLSAVNENQFFEQTPNVIVQLVNSAGGCWNSTFTTSVRNTSRSFRTKYTKTVVN